jgi:hypothetical protein
MRQRHDVGVMTINKYCNLTGLCAIGTVAYDRLHVCTYISTKGTKIEKTNTSETRNEPHQRRGLSILIYVSSYSYFFSSEMNGNNLKSDGVSLLKGYCFCEQALFLNH